MADPLKRVDCVRCGKQHVGKFVVLLTCPNCKVLLPDAYVLIVLLFFPGLGMLVARLVMFLIPIEALQSNIFLNSYVGQLLSRGLVRVDTLFHWITSPFFDFPETVSMISIYGWQDFPLSLQFSVFGVGFGVGIYLYRVIQYPLIRRLGWVHEKRSDSWLAISENKAMDTKDKNTAAETDSQLTRLDSKFVLTTQLTGYKFYKLGEDLNKLGDGSPIEKKRYFKCPRCRKKLLYPSLPNCPHCNRDMNDFIEISNSPAFYERRMRGKILELELARKNVVEAQEELNYAIVNKFPESRIKDLENLLDLTKLELDLAESKARSGKKQQYTLFERFGDWVASIIEEAEEECIFSCKACNGLVKRDTVQCPHCGIWLSGIECQGCGYRGREDEFVNNRCPACDGMTVDVQENQDNTDLTL